MFKLLNFPLNPKNLSYVLATTLSKMKLIYTNICKTTEKQPCINWWNDITLWNILKAILKPHLSILTTSASRMLRRTCSTGISPAYPAPQPKVLERSFPVPRGRIVTLGINWSWPWHRTVHKSSRYVTNFTQSSPKYPHFQSWAFKGQYSKKTTGMQIFKA